MILEPHFLGIFSIPTVPLMGWGGFFLFDVFSSEFVLTKIIKAINTSFKLKMTNICIFVTYGTRDVWDKKINK